MSKSIFFTALFCLFFSSIFGLSIERGSDDPKLLSIYFKVIPDYIIGGNITDYQYALEPSADSLPVSFLGAGFDFYFFNWLGLTGGYDFNGNLQYVKKEYRTLTIANLSKIFIGLTGRFPLFRLEDDSSRYAKAMLFDLKLTAGGNYTFFDLTPAYKSKFEPSGYVFYTGPATGFGFFAGGGLEITIGVMLIGINAHFDYLNFKFPEASTGFTMITIELPIYVGITF